MTSKTDDVDKALKEAGERQPTDAERESLENAVANAQGVARGHNG